jgi:hypothetical protein
MKCVKVLDNSRELQPTLKKKNKTSDEDTTKHRSKKINNQR